MFNLIKCKGKGCDNKDNCYRHTSYKQSDIHWIKIPMQIVGEDQYCKYYISNNGCETKRKLGLNIQ